MQNQTCQPNLKKALLQGVITKREYFILRHNRKKK